MPTIHRDYELRDHNTFGIAATCSGFVRVESEQELREVLQQRGDLEPFVLGGGSNMLLTRHQEGKLFIKNDIRARHMLHESPSHVIVEAGGGEPWHDFVLWSLEQGYGGLENLSLIPGTVGAAPIQNIGAYGVELKDVFYSLRAMHIATGEMRTFDRFDCDFGYRDSVFKRDLKGQYAITRVRMQLTREGHHELHTDYGAIREALSNQSITDPTPADISRAVVSIRQSKLPDPAELGNSGSFFKNPELSREHFEQLQAAHPEVVYYDLPDGRVKVPAGWLIEQCGYKGKRIGNTGAHAHQALVLVNYGGATGDEVWAFAQEIQAAVRDRFGVEIQPEVNVL